MEKFEFLSLFIFITWLGLKIGFEIIIKNIS